MNNQDIFTRVVATLGLGAALIALTLSLVTYSSAPSEAPPSAASSTIPAVPESQEDVEARAFQTLVYLTNGGDKQVVASGGELEVQSGATLDIQAGATTDFSGGIDLDGGLLDLDADGNTSIQADTDNQIDIEIGGSDILSATATGLYLSGSTVTWDADEDTTSIASSDDIVTTTLGAATGRFDILTGNFKLGNGTPTLTQNGEDAYVEGTFEVDGQSQLDGGLDLNASTLTFDADADTTAVASFDDVITFTLGAATGRVDVLTGNLAIGNGTPTLTQDGEDAYVEGTFEVDGQSQFDGGIDLNGSTLTIDADTDTTLAASTDDILTITLGAAAGRLDLLTGNLAVGNGTPDTALDGEDAYVEGTLEVDGVADFDGGLTFGASTLNPLGHASANKQWICGEQTITGTASVATGHSAVDNAIVSLVTDPGTGAGDPFLVSVDSPSTTTITINVWQDDASAGSSGAAVQWCALGDP